MFVRTIFAAFVAAASPVFPLAIDLLPRDEKAITVQLSAAGNTAINAVITNSGEDTISLLNLDSLLDPDPVQKVEVYKDGYVLPFKGISRFHMMSDLSESEFTVLTPGQSVDVDFDVAEIYDLSSGGFFTVVAHGVFSFANGEETTIAGAIPFASNELQLSDVDGTTASFIPLAAKKHSKRTVIDGGCTGDRKVSLEIAIGNAREYAYLAYSAANNGDAAKFEEYFLTRDASTRRKAAQRLLGISIEASSPLHGVTRYHCTDPWGWCNRPNVIAYTLPDDNFIVNCEGYWNLPRYSTGCHAADQGYVILHEMTHCPRIMEPWCRDHAYGYDAIRRLTPAQAINNADTFAQYAGAIRRAC